MARSFDTSAPLPSLRDQKRPSKRQQTQHDPPKQTQVRHAPMPRWARHNHRLETCRHLLSVPGAYTGTPRSERVSTRFAEPPSNPSELRHKRTQHPTRLANGPTPMHPLSTHITIATESSAMTLASRWRCRWRCKRCATRRRCSTNARPADTLRCARAEVWCVATLAVLAEFWRHWGRLPEPLKRRLSAAQGRRTRAPQKARRKGRSRGAGARCGRGPKPTRKQVCISPCTCFFRIPRLPLRSGPGNFARPSTKVRGCGRRQHRQESAA